MKTLALAIFLSSSFAFADPVSYLCTFRAGPDTVTSIAVTNDGTIATAPLGANRYFTMSVSDVQSPRFSNDQTVSVWVTPTPVVTNGSPYLAGTITTGQDMFQFQAQTTPGSPGINDMSLFCQL